MLKTLAGLVLGGVLAVMSVAGAGAEPSNGKLLASGLKGTIGGTIGPDGALYVPEGAAGKITRIDPATGQATTFASGLPNSIIGIGGAIDVAFVGTTAYVLVTLVAADVGGSNVDGIYRMDDADSFTVIADLGAFSAAHLPAYPVDVPSGLQYALQPIPGGFLVSDGHHNRVLRVSMTGDVFELIAFGNIVPTGLAASGSSVYMSEAGPVPHLPANGKVVSFGLNGPTAKDVASGFSLIVDVEFGPGGVLYALSQGDSPGAVAPASPAKPTSGRLLRINSNGTFSVLVDALNLPTSLDFAGDTAFVVTLNGEVWKIDGVSKLGEIASAARPISPPSTGDGGLAAAPSSPLMSLAVVVGAALGASALVWSRRGYS